MINGKRKGNSFERLIYKELRLKDKETKRTLGSGSSDETGDILYGKYAIECKHLKKITWYILEKFHQKLDKELHTKVIDGELTRRIPVIIFRENREPIKVYMEQVVEGTALKLKMVMLYDDWKRIF